MIPLILWLIGLKAWAVATLIIGAILTVYALICASASTWKDN